MGSTNFGTLINGRTLKGAFERACADTEHGHIGSIGDKVHDGIVLAADKAMHPDEAEALAWRIMDVDGRFSSAYGPAGAIPVLSVEQLGRRVVTCALTVDHDESMTQPRLREAVTPMLVVEAGERIDHVRVLSDEHALRTDVRANEGARVTRYVVVRAGTLTPVLPERHHSQASARAAAKTWLRSQSRPAAVEVIGLVVREREDGQEVGLVGGATATKGRTLTVEVGIVDERIVPGPVRAWYAFGWIRI